MLAACILFALPSIKETWVNANTHPVYNSRVQAIPMRGMYGNHWQARPAINEPEIQKITAVAECALYRHVVAMFEAELRKAIAQPVPDQKKIESIQTIIAEYNLKMAKHAELLRKYPELEAHIEAERKRYAPEQD